MNVIERFLKYVSFDTQSDENSGTQPSTEKQKVLGAFLAEELKDMGAKDAHMDEHGYVYGWLPATPGHEEEPAWGSLPTWTRLPTPPARTSGPALWSMRGEISSSTRRRIW